MADGVVSSSGQTVELHCPTCERSFEPGTIRCPDDGTELVRLPVDDDLAGRDLDGRFTVREKLGAGGMGAVYRAWQSSVGREVALKIIHRRHASEAAAAKRFLREAKLASRLSHPHTVSVLDFGQTQDGLLYLAMELLRGRTLAEVLKADGPFGVQRLVRVGGQLCDALEAAHRLHIVHRDLKPGNVIVLDDPPGRDLLKVLDFGLAKSVSVEETHSTVSRAGSVLGTPAYMAPEQVLGHEVDARTDLYSLGVVLYELASGRLPFEAPNGQGMMLAHAHDPPAPLSEVPPVLESVILRLLKKEPSQRFQSAALLREALLAAAEQASRRPASAPSPTASVAPAFASTEVAPPRTSPVRWLVVGLVGIAAAATAIVVLTRDGERARAPSAAPPLVPADAGPRVVASPAAPAVPDAAPVVVAPSPTAPAAIDAGRPSRRTSSRRTKPVIDAAAVRTMPVDAGVPAVRRDPPDAGKKASDWFERRGTP